jgi:ATP P2X receptor
MFCVYPTVKYVAIQDTRLVVLRYILLLAIAIYVGGFELFAFGGWLEPSPVVGVVRFSLQQPTVDNCDPVLPNCDNAFEPLDQLPYCQQSNIEYHGQVYPCEIYEAVNAQLTSEKSLTVITRASTIPQQLICNNQTIHSHACPKTYKNLQPERKFYTAQAEAFTVLIDHAVTASKICTRHGGGVSSNNYACSAESPVYPGRLYSTNPHLCQQESIQHNAFSSVRGTQPTTTAPCYINPNRTTTAHQDFFSLQVLLHAAGISLDDCNQLSNNTNDGTCQTYRDSGATLLLNIYWNDFVPYHGLVEPHYYYAPQIVARSAYKQTTAYYSQYRDSRTLLNAHGIRIAVLLGGEFNQFNIVTFLVTVTTAFGLLALATTIVDSLMLYILPEKERYRQVVFENTEQFESNDVVSHVVRSGFQQTTTVVRSLVAGTSSERGGRGEDDDNSITEPFISSTENQQETE